jgi:hypothetical protein
MHLRLEGISGIVCKEPFASTWTWDVSGRRCLLYQLGRVWCVNQRNCTLFSERTSNFLRVLLNDREIW